MDFKPGSKCFAKVKGYSPWPARIDVLPSDVKIPRGKYPVFFYGTHEVSYVTAKDIYDFDKFRPVYGMYKEKNPKFNNGISEIDNNPTIYQLGIDNRAIEFLSQFYKFDPAKMRNEMKPPSPEIIPDAKQLKLEEPQPAQKNESLMKIEDSPISIIIKEPEKKELVDNSQVPIMPKKDPLNTILNSFKSPSKASNSSRPKRASAIKFKQNFLSYLKNLSSIPKHSSRKPDVLSRIKRDKEDKLRKAERKIAAADEVQNQIKIEGEISSDNVTNLFTHRIQNESIINHVTSSMDTKDESQLRIVSKLSIIDKEIKRSLIVGQENHEKCRMMMNSMLELNNLTLVLLCRVPEIIVTIKKCRRYKKDDSIKSSASKIFLDFLKIYEQSELDEKIEAGTELLKRHTSNCKSAQMLLDELFGLEKAALTVKQKVPNLVLSSPSSVHSFHSSANNTPLLNNEPSTDASDIGCTLDPDMTNINELVKSGILELIESYSFEESSARSRKKSNSKEIWPLIDDVELYKQLGV